MRTDPVEPSANFETLFAALNEINSPELKIVTAEDPIEYTLAGVNQMQVDTAAGFGFVEGLRHFTRTFPKTLSEIDRVLTRNAVWVGRTQGVGVLTAAEATNHSLSGPMLRASGVPYDVRRDKPYLDYDSYEFDVPVGEHGDVYDR